MATRRIANPRQCVFESHPDLQPAMREHMITVETTAFDPNHPVIQQFQTAVFADHGLIFDQWQAIASHRQWLKETQHLGRDLNDCYRWLPYRIRNKQDICVVRWQDQPVHVSFSELHGSWLRIGVNYYTLRDHRAVVRNPLWNRSWGYFAQLLQRPCRGHFASYHEANDKLRAMVRMLRQPQRRSGVLGGASTWLREFAIRGPAIEFNSVPQHISYRSAGSCDDWQDCLDWLTHTSGRL